LGEQSSREQNSWGEKILVEEKDRCELKYVHPKQVCNNENCIGYWNIGNNYIFITIPSSLSKSFHWSRTLPNVILPFEKKHQFRPLTYFQNHCIKAPPLHNNYHRL
jgi:hypothetical protein